MRFYFHEHAETEFDRAVEYYEDCRHGLGIDFAQEGFKSPLLTSALKNNEDEEKDP